MDSWLDKILHPIEMAYLRLKPPPKDRADTGWAVTNDTMADYQILERWTLETGWQRKVKTFRSDQIKQREERGHLTTSDLSL